MTHNLKILTEEYDVFLDGMDSRLMLKENDPNKLTIEDVWDKMSGWYGRIRERVANRKDGPITDETGMAVYSKLGCLCLVMRWWSVRFVLCLAIVIRLLAGLRCLLLASRAVILICQSFLIGLLFIFCSDMLVRWTGLIIFWLTIAFSCDCNASAILDLLAAFAKLFASFVFLLIVVVVSTSCFLVAPIRLLFCWRF